MVGAILTPNELVLTFGGLHLCVKFGENLQRNATVRVMTDGRTDRQTQTDFIICPIAICYSYGADKNLKKTVFTVSNCEVRNTCLSVVTSQNNLLYFELQCKYWYSVIFCILLLYRG